MRIEQLTKQTITALKAELTERTARGYQKEEREVAEILDRVRAEGDRAVLSYTERFDGATLTSADLEVREEEIRAAYAEVPEDFVRILRRAIDRIRRFHENERETGWFMTEEDGSFLGKRIFPMDRTGIYAPGGKAAYPSSVLMNAVPAKVAGVPELILCTPCGRDGRVPASTLVAAKEAGADRIFRIGGAQAIAAMAYGTETIPKVDKITGPGNLYVALAKKLCFGAVSIDAVAGPSEVLVIADDTADPRYTARDLLSQAEHDQRASAILICRSREFAEKVLELIHSYVPQMERKEILIASLEQYGRILIAESEEDLVDAANLIASEHVEIMTKDPMALMPKIRHAGAIFLGPYATEPLGDYMAGPNHILPTGGTARFFSPLSVRDFMKESSVIYFTEPALASLKEDIISFARTEGLTAHAASVAARFEEESK